MRLEQLRNIIEFARRRAVIRVIGIFIYLFHFFFAFPRVTRRRVTLGFPSPIQPEM